MSAPASQRVWDRPVAEFLNLLHLAPPVCRPDDSMASIVAAFSADPGARSVFVVDSEDRILGAISEHNLDVDLLTMALPQELWPSIADLGTRDLVRAAKGNARRARDLMTAARSVSASAPLRDAVAAMSKHGESVVALVDDSHRLIGYVALFEVLADLIAAHQA